LNLNFHKKTLLHPYKQPCSPVNPSFVSIKKKITFVFDVLVINWILTWLYYTIMDPYHLQLNSKIYMKICARQSQSPAPWPLLSKGGRSVQLIAELQRTMPMLLCTGMVPQMMKLIRNVGFSSRALWINDLDARNSYYWPCVVIGRKFVLNSRTGIVPFLCLGNLYSCALPIYQISGLNSHFMCRGCAPKPTKLQLNRKQATNFLFLFRLLIISHIVERSINNVYGLVLDKTTSSPVTTFENATSYNAVGLWSVSNCQLFWNRENNRRHGIHFWNEKQWVNTYHLVFASWNFLLNHIRQPSNTKCRVHELFLIIFSYLPFLFLDSPFAQSRLFCFSFGVPTTTIPPFSPCFGSCCGYCSLFSI
jgi:hypothetical protein